MNEIDAFLQKLLNGNQNRDNADDDDEDDGDMIPMCRPCLLGDTTKQQCIL